MARWTDEPAVAEHRLCAVQSARPRTRLSAARAGAGRIRTVALAAGLGCYDTKHRPTIIAVWLPTGACCRSENTTESAETTIMDDHELEWAFGQIFDAEDLCEVGAYEDAIALCDEVLETCGECDDEDVHEAIAHALLCRGRSFAALERFEDELWCYSELLKRFESDGPAIIDPLVAEAQFNAAVVTGQMGYTEESIGKYAAFIDRYKWHEQPQIQDQVIRAQFNWAVTLAHSDRRKEALSQLNKLIVRYGDSSEPQYDITVIRALISKAGLELCMGQTKTAIASASLGVEKCDTSYSAERFHCHLVLATAYLISQEIESGEKHVASLLDLLPEIEDFPPAANFQFSLRDMAMIIGRDRILELIQRSPSAAILAPLVDTLKQKVRNDSERLKGIQEMAEDLETDFASFGG